MTHETIERYLNTILIPQLKALEVQDGLIQNAIDTIRKQMASCLSHWNDERLRYALLTIGDEEAAFYEPKESHDVRSFVVVTVRNSALETIHTLTTSRGWRGKALSPEIMRDITSAAIEYFKTVDFPTLAEEIGEIKKNDIYGELAARYPIAWEALAQIGESECQIIEYPPVKVSEKPNLHNLKPQKADTIKAKIEGDIARTTEETSDGYALAISPELSDGIRQRIQDNVPFIVDSFKGVSRNIEKLLTIMEYLLWHNIIFITSNFFIHNGYIECRTELVKPGSTMVEMAKNWRNADGLARNHKGWLQTAADVAGG